MKRIALIILFIAGLGFAYPKAHAQIPLGPTATACRNGNCTGITDPVGTCDQYTPRYTNTATSTLWACGIQNTWQQIGGGSGSAVFPASPGIVYNTSTTASRNATSPDIDTLLTLGALPVPANVALDFYQTTGTTVTDATGNGNNCVLGGAIAPVLSTAGAYFDIGSFCGPLPSAVNSNRSFEYVFYKDPLDQGTNSTGGGAVVTYPELSSSDSGLTGISDLIGNFTGSTIQSSGYYYRPGTFANNATTACNRAFSGFNDVIVTHGNNATTDKDRVYINGVECTAYVNQSATAGTQSGSMYIGAAPVSPWVSSGLRGRMYAVRGFAAELTPAQALQTSQITVASVARHGIATGPVKTIPTTPILYVDSDSIGCGFNTPSSCGPGTETPGTNAWPNLIGALLKNQPAYAVRSDSIYGIKASQIKSHELNRIATRCATVSGGASVILDLAFNDVATISGTATTAQLQAVFDDNVNIALTLKAAGCGPIFLGTMTSNATGNETNRIGYNTIALQEWKGTGVFAAILDRAAAPELGLSGASGTSSGTASTAYATNTTSCTGNLWDGVHPNCTGQTLIANTYANGLNAYYGSTIANPSLPTITAGAYSMMASDTYVRLDSTNVSANSTLKLPSCLGQAGAAYTIANNQATYTVSLNTFNSAQTINGVDYSSTTLTIPSNTSKTFTCNSNGAGASKWVM